MDAIASAHDLTERLHRVGHLVDEGLATIGLIALRLNRPLLLEGEPERARWPSLR